MTTSLSGNSIASCPVTVPGNTHFYLATKIRSNTSAARRDILLTLNNTLDVAGFAISGELMEQLLRGEASSVFRQSPICGQHVSVPKGLRVRGLQSQHM